jgi:acyl-CoA reductase-like NAD-dependent aldehyde dehydrogenase
LLFRRELSSVDAMIRNFIDGEWVEGMEGGTFQSINPANTAEGFRFGNGLSPQVDVGPVVGEARMEKILRHIETGQKEGAKLVIAGPEKPSGSFRSPLFNGYGVTCGRPCRT